MEVHVCNNSRVYKEQTLTALSANTRVVSYLESNEFDRESSLSTCSLFFICLCLDKIVRTLLCVFLIKCNESRRKRREKCNVS